MEVLTAILLDLFSTIFAYLCLPTIYCLRRTQLTPSQVKKIVIVNSVCVWLIFTIIRIANGTGGIAGGFLWCYVANWLMKKYCLKTEEKHETKYEQKYSATPIHTEKMSLSNIGEVPKQYGDYNVYGSDISLKPIEKTKNDDIEKTKNDDIADIVIRLLNDEEFLSAVKKVNQLDKEKLSSLLRFL